MAILGKNPAGMSMMTLHNYGDQWGKEKWTKTDFNKLPLSQLTNENQYNAVSVQSTRRLNLAPMLYSRVRRPV